MDVRAIRKKHNRTKAVKYNFGNDMPPSALLMPTIILDPDVQACSYGKPFIVFI
jgi:hypothetical protein